jgi:hypothetical protein
MTASAREGGCLCGRVRFRLTSKPVLTVACHCRECQHMTASAFSLGALHPADTFEITQGLPVLGGLHSPTRHFHCPHCLCWIYTKPSGTESVVFVRATLLDDVSDFEPFAQFNVSEKLRWADTPAAHSFPGYPTAEEFSYLVSEATSRKL